MHVAEDDGSHVGGHRRCGRTHGATSLQHSSGNDQSGDGRGAVSRRICGAGARDLPASSVRAHHALDAGKSSTT